MTNFLTDTNCAETTKPLFLAHARECHNGCHCGCPRAPPSPIKCEDVAIGKPIGKDALGSTRLCEQVDPDGKLLDPAELGLVLTTYLEEGGAILVCPLCWVARYGNLPGSKGDLIPNGTGKVDVTTPVPLLLGADKVIHYQ